MLCHQYDSLHFQKQPHNISRPYWNRSAKNQPLLSKLEQKDGEMAEKSAHGYL